MNLKLMRLDEKYIHRIVVDAINRVLTENNQRFETFYRGYNSQYDSQRSHLFWITDNASYAKEYGDVAEEITVDKNKMRIASIYGIDDIIGEFDYYDGPDEDETKLILSQGYNGYGFYANEDDSYCICLLSSIPIVRRRVLTKEEYENID